MSWHHFRKAAIGGLSPKELGENFGFHITPFESDFQHSLEEPAKEHHEARIAETERSAENKCFGGSIFIFCFVHDTYGEARKPGCLDSDSSAP